MKFYRNEFKGHLATQIQGGGHRTLVTPDGVSPILTTDTTYHGPGFLLSYMLGMGESIIFIGHTMVDDGVIKVWHALLVKSQNAVATEADVAAARAYQEASRVAFAQDFDVWANKRPALQILQVPGRRPVPQGRASGTSSSTTSAPASRSSSSRSRACSTAWWACPARFEEAETAA